jgi:hypothetical protein
MTDQQPLLDRLAMAEDAAADRLGPDLPQGTQVIEADRRAAWSEAWVLQARWSAQGDDAIALAKATTHLARARELLQEVVNP